MERGILERWLREGLSLEAMGDRAGKNPSTISYWLRKYDLRATHSDRNAPKGGLEETTLRALVDRGLSSRQIAQELDLSLATVRHWLRRYDLETMRTVELREHRAARAGGDVEITRVCPTHGETRFRWIGPRYLCAACNAERVSERRRKVKAILVEEAGGRCSLCGYDRHVGALQFHHVDPARKSFHLASRGVARSIERARAEAAKCVLLCANCHAEVEGGVVVVPLSLDPPG